MDCAGRPGFDIHAAFPAVADKNSTEENDAAVPILSRKFCHFHRYHLHRFHAVLIHRCRQRAHEGH